MAWMAARLNAAGIRPSPYGYSAFERVEPCLDRLRRHVESRASDEPFVLIGHSFGTVLIRAILPKLDATPSACFLVAPVARISRAARTLAQWGMLEMAAGKLGQALVDEQFIGSLPVPKVPTRVYAGTAGPVGPWSPFGSEPNDGMMTVADTRIDSVPVKTVPALHPFVMNSETVVRDIVDTVKGLSAARAAA
jgi:hypothetical protein